MVDHLVVTMIDAFRPYNEVMVQRLTPISFVVFPSTVNSGGGRATVTLEFTATQRPSAVSPVRCHTLNDIRQVCYLALAKFRYSRHITVKVE